MSFLAFILALLVAAVGWGGIEHLRAERYKSALGERDAQVAAQVERRRAEVSAWVLEADRRRQAADDALRNRQVEIRTVYRTLREEVPVYVTSFADSRGWVTRGWVLLHDAAATGAPIPAGSASLVDSPSGVAPSAAAETVIENYAQCRQWREQLIGWQQWYETESSTWNEPLR